MSARIARIGNEISDWTVGHDQTGGRFQSSCFVHSKTSPKVNDRRGFAPFENATESVLGEASAGRGECSARRVRAKRRFKKTANRTNDGAVSILLISLSVILTTLT